MSWSIKLWAVRITLENLKKAEMDKSADNGLVGLLNQVNEARVAVIFTEQADGRVKLSLRSKRGYNVGTVAKEVGGGGHTQASGATIDGPLDIAYERIMPMLRKVVDDGELIIA